MYFGYVIITASFKPQMEKMVLFVKMFIFLSRDFILLCYLCLEIINLRPQVHYHVKRNRN